jgi:hypothetical protein
MEITTEQFIAFLGIFATLIAGLLTYYFSKIKDIRLKELDFKIHIYNQLMIGFSDLGSPHKTYEAHQKVANAISLINLFGNKDVLTKINNLLDYLNSKKQDYEIDEQDRLTNDIILSIRKDLKQKNRKMKNFKFQIISSGIKAGEIIE